MSANKEKQPPKNDNSNPQQGNQYVAPSKKSERGGSGNGNVTPNDVGATASAMAVSARNAVKVPPTKKDSRKLFVGGIASTVTDDDFLMFFQQFGVVVDSVVMFDKETRRSRGFGFVTFEEQSVAQAVLHKSRSEQECIKIKGKVCEVKPAEPKALVDSNRSGGPPTISKSGRGVGRVSGAVLPPGQSVMPQSSVRGTWQDNSLQAMPDPGMPSPYMHYPSQFLPSYPSYPENGVGFASPGYVSSYHPPPMYMHDPNAMAYYPPEIAYPPYGVIATDPYVASSGNGHQYPWHSPAFAPTAPVPVSGMHPYPTAFVPAMSAAPANRMSPEVHDMDESVQGKDEEAS